MEILLNTMNKDRTIVQSLQTITLRNNFGIYGQRCILLLSEATQFLLEGKKLSGKPKYYIERGLWDDLRVTFPIQSLSNNVTNYGQIKKDISKLVTIPVCYKTEEKESYFTLLSAIDFYPNSGNISITIRPEVGEALLDFTKGWRKVNLNTALQIRLSYSLRFYQLLRGQTKPIRYSIVELKKILGLENKYKSGGVAPFVKKVLEPARKNLISQNIPAFDYVPYYDENTTKKGRKSVKGFIFTAWPDSKYKDEQIMSKYGNFLFPALSQGVKNYLMQGLGFSERQIKNNRALLERGQAEISDFMGYLRELREYIIKRKTSEEPIKNPIGYIIDSIKQKLS